MKQGAIIQQRTRPHLYGFDGVRGFAALQVFGQHVHKMGGVGLSEYDIGNALSVFHSMTVANTLGQGYSSPYILCTFRPCNRKFFIVVSVYLRSGKRGRPIHSTLLQSEDRSD